MDFFGPREVLIVVGLLVVLAILLDGARRVKRNRYEKLHMSSRKMQQVFDDDDDGLDDVFDKSQFPSGGSRVVGIRDDKDLEQVEQSLRRSAEQKPTLAFNKQPVQNQFELEQPPSPESTTTSKGASDQPQEVLVMHLMAEKDTTINGQKLLDAALAEGFRYGAMKIFHRHQNDDGSGPVLFSMASAVNPGTFDLKSMGEINIPGITIFMALDDLEDPVSSFDLLIKVVDNISGALLLNVQDETRSSMTKQTIDHYRQRAREVSFRRASAK